MEHENEKCEPADVKALEVSFFRLSFPAIDRLFVVRHRFWDPKKETNTL
jgi:hypothetical protein